MKEIMNEWRRYTLLKESMADYNEDVKLVQGYIDNPKKYNISDVIEASRRIISNDNQRYWRYAGQYGNADVLKASDPNSVWNKAVELAGKNAKSTEPIGTTLQRDFYNKYKINLPFLDPSVTRDLHPYWKKNDAELGALLQTGADIFLDLNSILFILLILITGGLGSGLATVGGTYRVSKIFNNLHSVLKLQSRTKGARLAVQEVELFARKQLNKLVNSPYRNKIIIDQNTKVLRFQKIFDFFIGQALEKPVENTSKWIVNYCEEVLDGLEAILKKHGF